MTPLLRFLPAEYDDGLSSPKQAGLPNPREISKYLRETEHEQTSDEDSTIMLMQWGQFTDHDLSLTLPAPRKFVRNTDPILACMVEQKVFCPLQNFNVFRKNGKLPLRNSPKFCGKELKLG